MDASRAVGAAVAAARHLGLDARDAVVLNESNRLVVRLLPCDVVARVTPADHPWSAAAEVALAAQLAGAPIAPPDPRVEPRLYERDGFGVSFWTWCEPGPAPEAGAYADALVRLHGAMRDVQAEVPHVTDRLSATRRMLVDRGLTPDLAVRDRDALDDAMALTWTASEQLLHGEPHPGNVLAGPRFTDLENAAVGPGEYDVAWVPRAVAERYPGLDAGLLDRCRGAVLAIIATHRFRTDDRHPSGRQSGVTFLDAARRGSPWPTIDEV